MEAAELSVKFLQLLRENGPGKLKDGHWPISSWDSSPGVRSALDALSGHYEQGKALDARGYPTVFLNLFYSAGLALNRNTGASDTIPAAFMSAFGEGRSDGLADANEVIHADEGAQWARGTFHGTASGRGIRRVLQLSAALAALAECYGWSFHRLWNCLHGPYPLAGDGHVLIQDFNLAAEYPTSSGRLTAEPGAVGIRIVFQLGKAAAESRLLDFFGHLTCDLERVTESASVYLRTGSRRDGEPLTIRELTDIVSSAVRIISGETEAVNALDRSEQCAGFARRFMFATMWTMGLPETTMSDCLESLPSRVEPAEPWHRSRDEFLELLERAVDVSRTAPLSSGAAGRDGHVSGDLATPSWCGTDDVGRPIGGQQRLDTR